MEEVKKLSTIEEIRALSDPYRIQILNTIKKNARPTTVKQIADEMGEVPAKVHYHVKKLEKLDILRLAHTEAINGIIAKFYEPTARKFEIHNPELDSELSKHFINHAHKFVENLFNDSKKIFIDQLRKSDEKNDDKEKKTNEGNLSSSNLYLTKEEYQALVKYIEKLCEKHDKKDNNRVDAEEYHFFASIIQINKN